VVEGGKGKLGPEHLKVFGVTAEESITQSGVENVVTGLYLGGMADDAPHNRLFVNMGSGAVIFEDLPKNNGAVKINYYGDTVGFRNLDITPYRIAAEILNDLNEAFKMMYKYSGG
jgi:hypothetical protein